jgi:hypothetical protein
MGDRRHIALSCVLGLAALGCGSGSDRAPGAPALTPLAVSFGRLVDVHDRDPLGGSAAAG